MVLLLTGKPTSQKPKRRQSLVILMGVAILVVCNMATLPTSALERIRNGDEDFVVATTNRTSNSSSSSSVPVVVVAPRKNPSSSSSSNLQTSKNVDNNSSNSTTTTSTRTTISKTLPSSSSPVAAAKKPIVSVEHKNNNDNNDYYHMLDTSTLITADPATKCLLQEQYRMHNESIMDTKIWINNIPILTGVYTIQGKLYTTFTRAHITGKLSQRFRKGTWYCNSSTSQGGGGGDVQATVITGKAAIYSVDQVICPNTTTMISVLPAVTPPSAKNPNLNMSNYNRLYNYDLEVPLKCQQARDEQFFLAQAEEAKNLEHTKQKSSLKLGACTMIGGSKMTLRLREWIVYHRLLGVEHFWIYLHAPFETYTTTSATDNKNATTSTTTMNDETTTTTAVHRLPVASYITYIPYYPNKVHVHWQPAANQDCLFLAKKYNYDWIITTDVDEMIWVPPPPNLAVGDDDLASKPLLAEWIDNYPLLDYLSTRLRKSDYTLNGLIMKNIPFGTPTGNGTTSSLSTTTTTTTTRELQMDYVHRYNVSYWERWKNIIRVPLATEVNVHTVLGPTRRMNSETNEVSLRHFKRPDKGIHYPGEKKYKNPKKGQMEDSSLPRLFRDIVMERMASLE